MKITTFAVLSLIIAIQSSLLATPQKHRTILFGVSCLPQVTCVEEFDPYWRTDNWTEQRLVTDLKIMKSIGASCVRFAIFPGYPPKCTAWGISSEKYVRMIDVAVKTSNDLGLLVHMDICDGLEQYPTESIKYYLNRYKGKIDSYQISNERWDYAQNEEGLKWIQTLVELAHSIDPKAKLTADILVPDWVKIRKERPDLYRELNVGTAHYYPVTDYHGWNDLYILDLVDYLSNPTGRMTVAGVSYDTKRKLSDFGTYDAKAMSFDHDLYVGSWGWLDKEVWVTEISAHGYWRWGNLTPEAKRAADWIKVVDAVAGAKNNVTRMYHHCFRDKMSSREFGQGQSGIVYYDGSPRPATFAFKKMAEKYSPLNSPMRDIDCRIDRLVATEGASTADLKVTLINKTDSVLRGNASIELPSGITSKETVLRFGLLPRKSETWTIPVNVSQAHWGNNHAFVRVNIPHGLVYGWGIIAKPKRVEIDTTAKLVPDASPVRYVQGYDAVQQFFDKYGDDCAIITGPCIGSDMEAAYRLKTVMQAEQCREVQLRPSILAAEVLNRPVIVIGTPLNNLISHSIEMTLPEDQRITMTSPGPGKGLVNVVQAPFGQYKVEGRFSPQSEQLGYYFGACPTALYIAGPDDAGTRAAVYDLILRIWGKDEKFR